MEKTTLDPADVPTALPGFEDDDVREKLLLENSSDELEDTADEDNAEIEERGEKPNKRRWQVVRTFAAFAVFLCILVVAIAWFFGMGWFSKPQTQAVNRSGHQKDAQTSAPVTEDEKLKMALSMVAPASSAPVSTVHPDDSGVPVDIIQAGNPTGKGDVDDISPKAGAADQDAKASIGEKESYPFPLPNQISASKLSSSDPSKSVTAEIGTRSVPASKVTNSDDARGRSLFFGITMNRSAKDERTGSPEFEHPKPTPTTSPVEIPFGTILPVRLIGSIYTLRNSGGFVRLELTRHVEGKGYSYPAGTMLVGNVRGGESVRAFVSVVGLIDPVSGVLVKFSGELLGLDGASGIEGKRRNLTSQWGRFFRGMKDTAISVLGSVGAIRSGGTVILSEPLRRGTESMTEDLSGGFLKNEREDSFLEVPAGANGYVLVTGLPENSAATTSQPTQEARKE
ncbi:MAG TPA: hypothetical protein PKD26_14690 [Pyrinomonadaceae bacterium]|nr:hypothetical protein [Pyrinomonadaceae bacterium]